jgi:hypothetical protein
MRLADGPNGNGEGRAQDQAARAVRIVRPDAWAPALPMHLVSLTTI